MVKKDNGFIKLAGSIAGTLVDSLILYLYFTGALIGKSNSSRGMWEAAREAEEAFNEYKYSTFKCDINRLKKRGIIKSSKINGNIQIQITPKGTLHLAKFIPVYQVQRDWDKKLYLITYDISEKRRRDRDMLRWYLKKKGYAMLQKSIWITPYNPKAELKMLISEKNLQGQILVSDLGRDGAIGDRNISELMIEVFHLDKINLLYQSFIQKYKIINNKNNIWQMHLEYLEILKNDPQLPFELLPKNFLDKEAFKIYSRS